MKSPWIDWQSTKNGSQLKSHVLELLERTNLDHCGCRLGLEDDFFLGEGADALACFDSWLADGSDFEQARKDEFADGVLLDVALNHLGKTVENRRHLLAAEFGVGCDLLEDLSLGVTFFDCCFLGSHEWEFIEWATNVKTTDY